MGMLRYFVEHLPAHPSGPHHRSQRSVMLYHSNSHHWVRISPTTIIGIAKVRPESFGNLEDHPTCSLLPSLHLSTPVKDHLEKHHLKASSKTPGQSKIGNHFQALSRYVGIEDDDTTSDIIGKLISKGHSFLEPQI